VPRLYPILQGVTEEPGNHPVVGIRGLRVTTMTKNN